ncbi:hypothetical protein EOD40_15090 [Flavobacterium sufflavum]|uniref:Uncharacterized protein n=1 Tax=Flavobacterium sufflavum TaxID=1921138 RepID=A0A437KMY1_9FLAO|nr:hypothetical protein [Flavobacterium sufflavum]RVT72735.1 hypothetical protein EOD40_15090 [Flavobacterium sufflavum]
MKPKFKLFCILIISLCFYNCSAKLEKPEFVDNGKTVDSLKKAYNCENIDFENWEDKKVTDSCLTVRLINSSKVPSAEYSNPDKENLPLKEIASAIKKSLVKPQNYKLFHVIFIEKVGDVEAYSLGEEIQSKNL